MTPAGMFAMAFGQAILRNSLFCATVVLRPDAWLLRFGYFRGLAVRAAREWRPALDSPGTITLGAERGTPPVPGHRLPVNKRRHLPSPL